MMKQILGLVFLWNFFMFNGGWVKKYRTIFLCVKNLVKLFFEDIIFKISITRTAFYFSYKISVLVGLSNGVRQILEFNILEHEINPRIT